MEQIANLKVADLKKELKSRGLSTDGTKTLLQNRLRSALLSATDESAIDEEALIEDDSMLDDEDSNQDENFGDINEALELSKSKAESPTKSPPKSKAVDENNQNGDPNKKKKISINREPIQVRPTAPEPTPTTTTPGSPSKAALTSPGEEGDKKIVKITAPTAASIAEKKKLRMEKFGSSATVQAASGNFANEKMKKRAERFGIVGAPGKTVGSVTGKVALKTEDEAKIAARAKRFGEEKGGAVTSTPSTEATLDALQKRAARFGK